MKHEHRYALNTNPSILNTTHKTRKKGVEEHRRTLRIGLLMGPRAVRFLISEVPLYFT